MVIKSYILTKNTYAHQAFRRQRKDVRLQRIKQRNHITPSNLRLSFDIKKMRTNLRAMPLFLVTYKKASYYYNSLLFYM